MKVGIFYFSGTGATAKVADDISKIFGNHKIDVDIIRIKNGFTLKKDQYEYDLIGIGSPTYAFRAPRFLTNLLKLFPKSQKRFQFFFIFTTSGGMEGNTSWNIFKILNKKGWEFLGKIDIYGPTNLRSWMPIDEGFSNFELDKYSLNGILPFIEDIIKRYEKFINKSIKIKEIKLNCKPNFLYSIFSTFFTYSIMMRSTIGRKKINKNKCNKCKLCEIKICPSKCIQFNEKTYYPYFKEHLCIGCNACVNICPQNAIYSRKTKNHTQYNKYAKYILT